MHTVIVISAGLAILGVFVQIGRRMGGRTGIATWALRFVPLWFICAGVNLYFGVTEAGYTVAQEAPINLFVFAVPAALALLIWQRMGQRVG